MFHPHNQWIVILYLVDICFIIDLVLTFFTSYINIRGAEVFDSQSIAYNYMSSVNFYIDLLSVLGSEFLQLQKELSVLRLLKLLRIQKINKFIQRLNFTKEVKTVVRIAKLLFYLILWMHSQACIWNLVVSDHSEIIWIPPVDWVSLDIHARDDMDHWDGGLTQYKTMLYYSILFLTSNEVGGAVAVKHAFVSTILLLIN